MKRYKVIKGRCKSARDKDGAKDWYDTPAEAREAAGMPPPGFGVGQRVPEPNELPDGIERPLESTRMGQRAGVLMDEVAKQEAEVARLTNELSAAQDVLTDLQEDLKEAQEGAAKAAEQEQAERDEIVKATQDEANKAKSKPKRPKAAKVD